MNLDLQACFVTYQNHGIQFLYPDIWEIEEQQDGDDVIVTVTNSETCFWTVRILAAGPPPPQVVESCVSAFEEEYEDAEVEKSNDSLAQMPAYGRDVDFFCMELMNSVALRSVRLTDFTLLLWWQSTHHELSEVRPVFDQMTQSLQAISLTG